MARILNFGSLNIDYVYGVSHMVAPGETLAARDRSVYPGGKGLNQSVALARAGAAPGALLLESRDEHEGARRRARRHRGKRGRLV